MKSRAPAARWVATVTVIAVLMVLTALAVRMKLGDDPAIGAVSASSDTSTSQRSGSDAVQDLFDDGDDRASTPSPTPSAPSTSRAS